MRRIDKLFRAALSWLCGIRQDRLLHFVAGLLTVAVFALWHVLAPYAWTLGVLAGVGKEVYDERSGGTADPLDCLATAAGAFVMQAAVWAYLLIW